MGSVHADGDVCSVSRRALHHSSTHGADMSEIGHEDSERVKRSLRHLREYDRIASELLRWHQWSGGNFPDESPGDVIAWEPDGSIVLDDGVTTWNPLRALARAYKERAIQEHRQNAEHLRTAALAAGLDAAVEQFDADESEVIGA